VFEAASRAVNEVLAGRAIRVEITFTPDGGVRVADDGYGTQFEDDAETGAPGLHAALTRLMIREKHVGPRFPVLVRLGIGLPVVNALSSRLVAEVRCEGVRRFKEYAHGVVVSAASTDAGTSNAGTTDGSSGTSITFWPDADIFETTECSFAELSDRFRELTFLNQGLEISLTDARPAEARSVHFRSSGGARDMVAHLDEQEPALVGPEVFGLERDDPAMAGTVEVALRWRESGQERVRSFANSHPTPDGGTHVTGFYEGVAAALTAHARERRLLAATDPDFSGDAIGAGLTAVVSVKLEHPDFEGCTRGALGNPAARACVSRAVQQGLGTWLEEHPQQAAAVIDRLVHAPRRD
jgi:DNA gyrase subunit B